MYPSWSRQPVSPGLKSLSNRLRGSCTHQAAAQEGANHETGGDLAAYGAYREPRVAALPRVNGSMAQQGCGSPGGQAEPTRCIKSSIVFKPNGIPVDFSPGGFAGTPEDFHARILAIVIHTSHSRELEQRVMQDLMN